MKPKSEGLQCQAEESYLVYSDKPSVASKVVNKDIEKIAIVQQTSERRGMKN